MKVDVRKKRGNKYNGNVFVDGVNIGELVDCDGRYALLVKDGPKFARYAEFGGGFPGDSLAEAAFGIRECVAGVEAVSFEGRAL